VTTHKPESSQSVVVLPVSSDTGPVLGQQFVAIIIIFTYQFHNKYSNYISAKYSTAAVDTCNFCANNCLL